MAVAFCWCVSGDPGARRTLASCQPGLSSCLSSETPNNLLSLSFLFCKMKTVMHTLPVLVGTKDYTREEASSTCQGARWCSVTVPQLILTSLI